MFALSSKEDMLNYSTNQNKQQILQTKVETKHTKEQTSWQRDNPSQMHS